MGKNLVTRDTIVNLAKQIKANFTSKTAFAQMEQNVNSAFKSGEIVGSTIAPCFGLETQPQNRKWCCQLPGRPKGPF